MMHVYAKFAIIMRIKYRQKAFALLYIVFNAILGTEVSEVF